MRPSSCVISLSCSVLRLAGERSNCRRRMPLKMGIFSQHLTWYAISILTYIQKGTCTVFIHPYSHSLSLPMYEVDIFVWQQCLKLLAFLYSSFSFFSSPLSFTSLLLLLPLPCPPLSSCSSSPSFLPPPHLSGTRQCLLSP